MCVGETGTCQQSGTPGRVPTVTVDADPDVGRAQRCVCRAARHEQHAVSGSLQGADRGLETRTSGDQAVGGEPLS